MISEKRKEKFRNVFSARQDGLTLVMENIHDPHNVSAILRTCDAVGVDPVHLVYNVEKFPKIGKKSSSSAFKWVQREKHLTFAGCTESLRSKGFRVYSSILDPRAEDLYSLDFTENVAIVVGNEHRGISEEVVNNSDKLFFIPMYGMIQSLNVSVATAIVLYEALRQRKKAGLYENTISDAKLEAIVKKFSRQR